MKKINPIGFTLITALLLSSCIIKPEKSEKKTILVSGKASVETVNDRSLISFAIVTRNGSIQDASDENSEKTRDVIDSLKKLGIGNDDISTSDFRITQENSSANGRNIPGQYIVTNSIKVRVSPVERTGQIIDEIIKAGANRFLSVDFSSSKVEEAEKQARLLALRDAESKATILATASGLSLGKVLSISELQGQLGSSKTEVLSSNAREVPPVSGGKTDVNVSLDVVYEIQ